MRRHTLQKCVIAQSTVRPKHGRQRRKKKHEQFSGRARPRSRHARDAKALYLRYGHMRRLQNPLRYGAYLDVEVCSHTHSRVALSHHPNNGPLFPNQGKRPKKDTYRSSIAVQARLLRLAALRDFPIVSSMVSRQTPQLTSSDRHTRFIRQHPTRSPLI